MGALGGRPWHAASEVRLAGGTDDRYVGGFELRVQDYSALWTVSDSLFFAIPYDLDVRSVVDDHPELFQWLAMLDLNVELIIGLMLLIAILNMASALLLLLMLERTRSIGLLKALDGRCPAHGRVREVGRSHSVPRPALGQRHRIRIGVASVEDWVGHLDARSYYLSTVPIHLDVVRIASVELGILLACAAAMFLPPRYISQLKPVESLRFD